MFTLLGIFSIWGGRKNTIFWSENIFNLCCHIELNTQNPKPIFKLRICLQKHQKCQNTFELFENRKIEFLFCIMYKLYKLYFVLFGNFVNFVILGLLDFYIHIYYTCRSLTRVGLFPCTLSGKQKMGMRSEIPHPRANERVGISPPPPYGWLVRYSALIHGRSSFRITHTCIHAYITNNNTLIN